MRTVVITGGAKGIGRGVAERLHRDGANAVLVDRDEAAVAAAAKGIGCTHEVANVTDADGLADMFQRVADRYDGIDGLVNSAGLTRTGPTATLPLDDWQQVIDVNLTGTFYSCRLAVEHLVPGASIVNVASIAAVRALPERAAYTATKFGVVGLTRVLAVEWAERQIRVNAVGPTWTKTQLIDDLVDQGKLDESELAAKMPMGRLAEAADIAGAVSFLLSDDARFVTGQTLFVDGGYTWNG
ncbi:SDR family NAD(P)-dependent oxidoreductase [Streptomyces sp. NPDC005248]|uniref:SDR family NAD(P)-dependent oxidoreductase n=1 Tax=Streptomyces sp. NPDC005248 TaxID=3364709 RepID=UPI003687EFC7